MSHLEEVEIPPNLLHRVQGDYEALVFRPDGVEKTGKVDVSADRSRSALWFGEAVDIYKWCNISPFWAEAATAIMDGANIATGRQFSFATMVFAPKVKGLGRRFDCNFLTRGGSQFGLNVWRRDVAIYDNVDRCLFLYPGYISYMFED